MADHDGLAQTRSIKRAGKLAAAWKGRRRAATGTAAAFPVFGERQRREFEASPHPMRITEHGTLKYLAANDAAVKLYGYSREEFLELTILHTRHPEEHDELLATFAEPTGYLRYGPPRRQVKKSGEIILAEVVTQDILFNGRKARLSLTLDVTERKRTEQALLESNAFLRSLIESSQDCIKVLDLDGRLLMMSAGGQRLLRIDDIAPLLNASWLDFWKGGDRDAALAAVAAARAGGVGKFEGCCPTNKGEPRWWDVLITPIRDASGRPEKLLAISRDVTERREIERALHESEGKYRSLVESSSDLIWSADAAGRLTFINEALRRTYGYEPEEMLGRPVAQLLGDGQWKKSFGFFRKMLVEDRSVADYECEVRSRRGERIVLSSNAIVLRDAEGRRIGVTGVSKDVTARKRAEQTLREKSEFLQKMIESSRDCIEVLDLEGRVLWISAGGQRLMELNEVSSIAGRSYLDFWEGVDRKAAGRALDTACAGEPNEFEGYCPTSKGVPKWWDVIVTPILGGEGKPEKLLVVSRDITEHKRAEEERMQHTIRQRDALVREVHHRIKNNLQGVAGLLRRKISKYSALAPEIEEVIAQLQSVALIYGLQETRPDGLLDLAEVTDAICSSAESLIGGRVERSFERGSRRPACVAGSEAVSVAVALNELIVNALKHQPAVAGEKRARVRVCEGNDAAEIRISNRGCLPESFDFASGRAVGNGLGLVRILLASPGGDIAFNGGRDEVEVVLTLTRPLLAERDMAHAG
jgi:PAS domain S-box-containing protein